MSEAAKTPKLPTSALPRQSLAKAARTHRLYVHGSRENVQDSMLWRWMRWQSWHRNVGRWDGQTGILADLDREAINAQQKRAGDVSRGEQRNKAFVRWTAVCEMHMGQVGEVKVTMSRNWGRVFVSAWRFNLSPPSITTSTSIRSEISVSRKRPSPSREGLV